jgi:hypothetical protein
MLLRDFGEANVRFGSKADIPAINCDVHYSPKSGHRNWPAFRSAYALPEDPIKIERPAENDSADDRPNKCAEPSISRLVADNDAEPSTSYSRH